MIGTTVVVHNTRLEMIQQIEQQRSQAMESLQIFDNYQMSEMWTANDLFSIGLNN